jgi:hypothetical protein
MLDLQTCSNCGAEEDGMTVFHPRTNYWGDSVRTYKVMKDRLRTLLVEWELDPDCITEVQMQKLQLRAKDNVRSLYEINYFEEVLNNAIEATSIKTIKFECKCRVCFTSFRYDRVIVK